jgi:hypothetical protein
MKGYSMQPTTQKIVVAPVCFNQKMEPGKAGEWFLKIPGLNDRVMVFNDGSWYFVYSLDSVRGNTFNDQFSAACEAEDIILAHCLALLAMKTEDEPLQFPEDDENTRDTDPDLCVDLGCEQCKCDYHSPAPIEYDCDLSQPKRPLTRIVFVTIMSALLLLALGLMLLGCSPREQQTSVATQAASSTKSVDVQRRPIFPSVGPYHTGYPRKVADHHLSGQLRVMKATGR